MTYTTYAEAQAALFQSPVEQGSPCEDGFLGCVIYRETESFQSPVARGSPCEGLMRRYNARNNGWHPFTGGETAICTQIAAVRHPFLANLHG